jgi:hypothetical protein
MLIWHHLPKAMNGNDEVKGCLRLQASKEFSSDIEVARAR